MSELIQGLHTDKGVPYIAGDLSHASLYESLFRPYRSSAERVFEIGVREGGSIALWMKYFMNAQVYGLDVDFSKIRDDVSAAILLEVDQSSEKQLREFGDEHGPFDIGIDDGSHVWKHQILSFETLWPYISSGGLYVIEDVFTSFRSLLDKSRSQKVRRYDRGEISCVDFFKNLIDEINCNPDNKYFREIDYIGFRFNSLFVKKR